MKKEPKTYCAHTELVDIAALVENPRNPKRQPEKHVIALAEIIKQQGWRNAIVLSKRSGFIVKDHGRLLTTHLLKLKQVPASLGDIKAGYYKVNITYSNINYTASANAATLALELDGAQITLDELETHNLWEQKGAAEFKVEYPQHRRTIKQHYRRASRYEYRRLRSQRWRHCCRGQWQHMNSSPLHLG